VIDLSGAKPKKAAAPAAPTPTASDSKADKAGAPAQDHGALLRQAALDRIEGEDKTKKAATDKKAKEEADEKQKKETEEKAKKEADAKAKEQADVKAKEQAEEKTKKEADEKTKKEAEEKAKKEKPAGSALFPKASFSDLLKQPAPVAKEARVYSKDSGRIIFSKDDLLRYVSFNFLVPAELLDLYRCSSRANTRIESLLCT
jgi:hypothetical protein